jgi:arylsulfate sulfotransferase
MTNFFKFLFKENHLLVVIPGIFVVLIIIGFMIYGFSDPVLHTVPYQTSLIEQQTALKESFLEEYERGTYTPNDPYFILNPFEIAPLTGLILFETDTDVEFKLIVKGKTEEADVEFITERTSSHKIPIYGLYAGYANRIEIYDYDSETDTTGTMVSSIVVTTDELIDGVYNASEITTTYEYFGDDWMFLTPADQNKPVAIDAFGDVRWYSTEPLAFAMKQLGNGHYLVGSNRVMASPYYTTGLYEIDLLGKVYLEYYIPGGYHHDFVELDNGNLLVLSSDFNGTVEDIVVEIERSTGNVIKTWDLADYLDPLDGMAQMWTVSDWFHNNSIDYDPTTDTILLSGRHQDAVIGIGYTSNELQFVIGDPTNWTQSFVDQYFFTPVSDPFEWSYAQHSAMFLPDQTIFMFDNGNNRAKETDSYISANNNYSRGVIYELDMDTMEISELYSYGVNRGNSFYSPYISNVDYYDTNHYLIHSGGIARTLEGALNVPAPLYEGDLDVTKTSVTVELLDDVVVYELIMPDHYYRAIRISPYDDQTRVNLSTGSHLGSMMETMPYEGEVDLVFTLFHSIPTNYELTLVKEADRLIVEGIFDHEDEIYLLLENDTETIYYHIPASQTAYTAMCTAIFQGDERFITYYVNEENISGTYAIQIIINGHQYHTYQRVTFK